MEEFVRRYEQLYPKMYRTAYYYMQNAEEAEDAVSDAVLTAYEKRNQLKDKERFEAWMMRILVNRCKKRMKTWFRKDEPLESLTPSNEQSLTQNFDYAQAAAVKEVFWTLKDEERFIVALSVFGGYTSEEIAWILNKNHSTIRSKYRRALQKMKDKLEV